MLDGGTINLNPTYWHFKQSKFVLFHIRGSDRQSGIYWLASINVTPRGRIIGDEQLPLQKDSVNEVKYMNSLQMKSCLLICKTRNMKPDDLTDEGNIDEFEESDDPSDDPSDDSDDE